ncbi:chromosome segregation ATPase [Oscillatoria sp. FACHB-1406]|uniref:chromosome segregation ATPase n=1 Tax=Oscillatoria sp. FACHB-1406 TaxID=2692846 RepID=UPI0016832DD0|nr:chromosome segregation ATPase [Oscillatoria sp. FACHB-1406]MBD2578096.1 chromosome segregation ATPase [Oscillatoria sp. FACHB-1406]
MKDRENRNLRSPVGASKSSSGNSGSQLYRREGQPASRSGLSETGLQPSQEATRSAVTETPTPEQLPEDRLDTVDSERFPVPRWVFAWALAWQFWAVAVLGGAGTLGFLAANSLFKLPALPSCPSLFLPLASGSVRLYCAQIEADRQTTESLLEAIRWVEVLPKEHPLRGEVDRKIEEWSLQILDLVDETVQAGYLDRGIADARRIPKYVSAYKLVEERIAKWQSLWSKANKIVLEAEKLMLDSKWALAFRTASKLTTLNNNYWATTRYSQLVEKIRLAQEESAKLDKAFALMRQGGTDNLFEAIKLAEEIKPESTAHREAQKLLAEAGKKLLEIAMERLEAGDWSAVTDITNRIPAKLEIQEEIKDVNSLAEAGSQAGSGTADGLQAAIDAAKSVPPGRPLYNRAQRLIGRWELEIQDIQTLAKAEELANGGGTNYLMAAIAKARLIPPSHPRYREAQRKIAQWTDQMQPRESLPIAQANPTVESGNTGDLQRAIDETQSGSSSSIAFSPDIPTRSSRAVPDAPSTSTDSAAASGRELDGNGEVQRQSEGLGSEVRGRLELDRARQMARGGTSSALSSAIRIAQQVSSDSPLYNQSVQESNSWSERILSLAREQAGSNLSQAIETAQKVPDGTSAYAAARAQIEAWQQQLQPQIPANPPAIDPQSQTPPSTSDNTSF